MKSDSCNVQNFLIFSPKNLQNSAEKTFSRNYSLWFFFRSKFATFSDFENSQFFSKTDFLIQKIQNAYVFDKVFCFSEILRKLCYDFVKTKLYVQKREPSSWPQFANTRLRKRSIREDMNTMPKNSIVEKFQGHADGIFPIFSWRGLWLKLPSVWPIPDGVVMETAEDGLIICDNQWKPLLLLSCVFYSVYCFQLTLRLTMSVSYLTE